MPRCLGSGAGRSAGRSGSFRGLYGQASKPEHIARLCGTWAIPGRGESHATTASFGLERTPAFDLERGDMPGAGAYWVGRRGFPNIRRVE